MVAQCKPKDMEHVVYYLSKKLLSYGSKYNIMEKTFLAMIWAIRKLRHYFQSYKVQVVKGRAVAVVLSQNVIEGDHPWDMEFLDENLGAIEIQEWKMYFDGVVNARGAGCALLSRGLDNSSSNGTKREAIVLDLKRFIENKEYVEEEKFRERYTLQIQDRNYISHEGILYKRMVSGAQLRCVTKLEAQVVIEEMYKGVCGPHMKGIVLTRKIIWQGYYWLTMERDCIALVRKCREHQLHNDLSHIPLIELHNDLSHIPLTELHNLISSWPFAAWGIDIIGKIKPHSNGHKFIVVAIDYFSKLVEAVLFNSEGARQMARFIERNLICRYGVPHHVVMDNRV
ncbi:uncharacterized protein LOC107262205 [Ricinus communis]|uniref:uncharacterized protein LOC107262205 n=1 Tax=Ricinus communis TaxID=3988 RepID=UPI0007724560|nr:uncharacterized protein LOC107262205 [Ricinus communis]|eukprot:XP_015582066.1 uncharacterized protein LOC107262205 [Ricinus communis]